MGWKNESGRHSLAARGVPTTYPTMPINKMNDTSKINRVFERLEAQNILARANFSCCQSCASSELATLAEKENKAGYVFWHQQSEDALRRGNDLYIYYDGADDTNNPPPKGKSSKEVANIAYREFLRVGLDIEWDGSTNTAFKIKGLKL